MDSSTIALTMVSSVASFVGLMISLACAVTFAVRSGGTAAGVLGSLGFGGLTVAGLASFVVPLVAEVWPTSGVDVRTTVIIGGHALLDIARMGCLGLILAALVQLPSLRQRPDAPRPSGPPPVRSPG